MRHPKGFPTDCVKTKLQPKGQSAALPATSLETFFIIFFLICGFSARAHAEGNLKLVIDLNGFRQILSLTEEKNMYRGFIQEGFSLITSVEMVHGKNLYKISIGKNQYTIDRLNLGEFRNYGGIIFSQRGVSAQAEKAGKILKISGAIENDFNALIEFQAVSDEEEGILRLSWEKNLLILKKIPGHPSGKCEGTLIRENPSSFGKVYCSSDGALENALFWDPDQILTWLIFFLVY